MATLQVNAVGSYWNYANPSSNFSYDSPWVSGAAYNAYSNYWYMGFGFQKPSSFDLSAVKINSVTFYVGNLTYEHIYRDRFKEVYASISQDFYRYGASESSTLSSSIPSECYDSITVASPFTAYANNRFSSITWNNQNSYGAIQTYSTESIKSGANFSDTQIGYLTDAWGKGYLLGTPNYNGSLTTYSDDFHWIDQAEGWYMSKTERTYHTYYYVSNSSPYLLIDYTPIETTAKPSYPVNVNVKQGNKTVFTWTLSSTDTPTSGTAVQQTSYTLTITDPDGVATTYTEETSNLYKEFESNFFSVGAYSYTLSVTTNTGKTIDAGSATFNVIGGTDAPDITDVTNTSIPTITWTASYQDAVEIRVSQGGTILYESGLLPGSERTTFRVPKMFDDGEYTAELRVLNIYGYYTSYCSYPFTLNPTKPTAPSNVLITTNLDYGVDIKGDTVADTTTYVVRRERGETSAEIIGIYTSGTFTDYYVAGNKAYEYALRSYSEGFADSDYVSISVPLQGVTLRDCRGSKNLIHIYQNSELFDVDRSDSISSTLISCLGRPYPIKERGEWITTTRGISGYVSDDDYTKLTEMSLNAEKVYFQGTDEFMVCDMSISYTGRYASGGVFVKVSLTRIEDNLEVEI